MILLQLFRDQRDTAAIILKYTANVISNTFFPDDRNDIFTKVTRFCYRSFERFLKFVIFILLVLSSVVFDMRNMIVNVTFAINKENNEDFINVVAEKDKLIYNFFSFIFLKFV